MVTAFHPTARLSPSSPAPGRAPPRPLVDILERHRSAYAALLRQFEAFRNGLHDIALDRPPDADQPYWRNGYFSGLDAVSLYALAALYQPRPSIAGGAGPAPD